MNRLLDAFERLDLLSLATELKEQIDQWLRDKKNRTV